MEVNEEDDATSKEKKEESSKSQEKEVPSVLPLLLSWQWNIQFQIVKSKQ